MRVYNEQGRRDNMYNARIKILVNALGADQFRDLVETEWERIKDNVIDLSLDEVARIKAYFEEPAFDALSDDDIDVQSEEENRPRFERWLRTNTAPHKRTGYKIVNISLKPIGKAPGDITDQQMRVVADLAEEYSFDEARATHEQNLCLPHVKASDLFAVWTLLDEHEMATPNIGLASDIIACPGLDYCSLANARSIPIAERLGEAIEKRGGEEELGELKIKISGCINACGHHHVGHIGILGVDKKGE